MVKQQVFNRPVTINFSDTIAILHFLQTGCHGIKIYLQMVPFFYEGDLHFFTVRIQAQVKFLVGGQHFAAKMPGGYAVINLNG